MLQRHRAGHWARRRRCAVRRGAAGNPLTATCKGQLSKALSTLLRTNRVATPPPLATSGPRGLVRQRPLPGNLGGAARADIADYLDWYNAQRSHSRIDRLTPTEKYLAALPPLALAA